MSKRDYYDLLGVSKSSSADEIKKAYRKLAMQYHPDRNQGNAESEKKFKEINEAYEVLKDEDKKAAYDRHGHAAFDPSSGFGGGRGGQGGAGFNDFSDIFGDIFGDFMGGGGGRGQRQSAADLNRGSDLRYDLKISLETAFKGGKQQIQFRSSVKCDTCDGSGSKTKKTTKCGTCGGQGRIRAQQGFFMVERTCHTCNGVGETVVDPCGKCSGSGRITMSRTLNVNIPVGVEDGTRIRVTGEGEAGTRGGKPGDLYIFISISQHQLFKRQGTDLYCSIPLKMTTAALGGAIEVPTIDGARAKITIPEGTQNGAQFRLRGKGMPLVKSGGRVGDMIVQVSVEVPVKLTKKQKEILAEFDKECKDDANSPSTQSFFSKIKGIFKD